MSWIRFLLFSLVAISLNSAAWATDPTEFGSNNQTASQHQINEQAQSQGVSQNTYHQGVANAPDIFLGQACKDEGVSAGWLGASGSIGRGISEECFGEMLFNMYRVLGDVETQKLIARMMFFQWEIEWNRASDCDRRMHSWQRLWLGYVPPFLWLACELGK